MDMREAEFYKNVKIDEADKPRAERALKSKGVEKHILIKEDLMAWSESETIKYSQIASTYRYDKRIRNVLFKYISYLEEFYRAVILDNYHDKTKQRFWVDELRENLKTYENDLNQALERLDFSNLLWQVRRLPQAARTKCGFPSKHIKENTFALKELRNAVMHNKFLLLFRGFEVCYVEGVDSKKSANLKANILNLVNFLPSGAKEQCITDINACKEERNNENKTKWDLPAQVIVLI